MTTRAQFTATIVLLLAIGTLSGCGPSYSTLVVHNRTNAAISFANIRGEDQFVGSCASESFRWDGAWIDDTPVAPIQDAVDIRIDAAPPADATGAFAALVGSNEVVTVDPAASLPPCDGVPPTFLTLKVYSGTAVPVWFESGGEAHYVEACLNWRYEWIGGGWTNRLGSDTPIPGAVEVVVDVTPPPTKNNDFTVVVVTADGTFVVMDDPNPGPTPCTGSPPPVPRH
jgi:hypothetical protein